MRIFIVYLMVLVAFAVPFPQASTEPVISTSVIAAENTGNPDSKPAKSNIRIVPAAQSLPSKPGISTQTLPVRRTFFEQLTIDNPQVRNWFPGTAQAAKNKQPWALVQPVQGRATNYWNNNGDRIKKSVGQQFYKNAQSTGFLNEKGRINTKGAPVVVKMAEKSVGPQFGPKPKTKWQNLVGGLKSLLGMKSKRRKG